MLEKILPIVIASFITFVITAFVAWKLAISYRIKVYEAKIGSAEEKAREIIDEALKTAETKKREALLEAKEESLKTKSFEQAQVSSGGVDTREINPKTLESTLVKGLYFTGELIDVDGTCGGYNLQWAWSSGVVAARGLQG